MSKVVNYIKNNYIFVGIILLVIILFTVLVVVRLKDKNQNYSWSPIEGEVSYDIKKHEANEYKIITVEDQDIAVSYYRNWIYLVVNNPEEAYKLLSKNSLKEYDTYEKFLAWVNRYKTVNTQNNTLKGYSLKKNGGHNEFVILSSENMKYRLFEYSVWNYKVEIIGQERTTNSTTKLVTTKTTGKTTKAN